MHWLLGFHPHSDERACLYLTTLEQEAFLMPELNAKGSRSQTEVEFHLWSDGTGPEAALSAILEDLDFQANWLALDETMRADFALLLLDKLPNAARSLAGELISPLRMVKDDTEYRSLKDNALIADQAIQAGMASIRPGMSELELASAIRSSYGPNGAEPLFVIVCAGANGAFPHHSPSSAKLQNGDAVVIDTGGRQGKYSSDITRMAVVGEPPSGYQEVHSIVEAAAMAALAAARPGVPASNVDKAARDVIDAAGYGEFFVHRTGHGLGLEIHEPPYLTSTSTTLLEAGMVFSIEPGIYLPGRFGIRLEDIVYLRDEGPEILSELPRDLLIAGT